MNRKSFICGHFMFSIACSFIHIIRVGSDISATVKTNTSGCDVIFFHSILASAHKIDFVEMIKLSVDSFPCQLISLIKQEESC